jgi:hypothetical protein
MSKRTHGLAADELGNRWQNSISTSAALVSSALVGDTQSSKEIRHLDFLNIGLLNKNTLSFTVGAQVRDASVAGPVLWQMNFLLQNSQTVQVAPAGIHLVATPGKGFFMTTDTAQPSVSAVVNAAGWTDDSNG